MKVSVQLNYSHGYFTIYGLILGKSQQPWLFLESTLPHIDADIIAHLLFVIVIHMRPNTVVGCLPVVNCMRQHW